MIALGAAFLGARLSRAEDRRRRANEASARLEVIVFDLGRLMGEHWRPDYLERFDDKLDELSRTNLLEAPAINSRELTSQVARIVHWLGQQWAAVVDVARELELSDSMDDDGHGTGEMEKLVQLGRDGLGQAGVSLQLSRLDGRTDEPRRCQNWTSRLR